MKIKQRVIITEPVTVEVKDKDHIHKGQIFSKKGFYFISLHEKIAFDGMTTISCWFLGNKRAEEKT